MLEQGQSEPLIVVSPDQTERGKHSSAIVSALDLVPTVLDWTNIPYPPNARAAGQPATLTGGTRNEQ